MNCSRDGYCCRHLYLSDRIKISVSTRTLMLSERCNFLENHNVCSIYNSRPKVCRGWGTEEVQGEPE